MTFQDLQLTEPILKALQHEGYTHPTPIQQAAIPVALKHRDILGCAQTGTGKTAAFSIPIIEHLQHEPHKPGKRPIRALVLTPTRELAIQIGESFAAYGRFTSVSHTVVFGGVGQKPQTDALQQGIDVLTATPGRLLDLIHQGFIDLSTVKYFVLDEADRMLDMGFIGDVMKVAERLPSDKQTLFFSATMPLVIANLADSILRDPVRIEVTPVSSTVEQVEQYVYLINKSDKPSLLIKLLNDPSKESVLVFSRTRHGVDRIARTLSRNNILCGSIHGDKSQSARQKALGGFKDRTLRVLIATDIAARGIDIDGLSHVINYDLPNVPETYVHRIGRTGRAGMSGIALSFCDGDEMPYLRDIQKLTGRRIEIVHDHGFAEPTDHQSIALAATVSPATTSSRRKKSVTPAVASQGKPSNTRNKPSSAPHQPSGQAKSNRNSDSAPFERSSSHRSSGRRRPGQGFGGQKKRR